MAEQKQKNTKRKRRVFQLYYNCNCNYILFTNLSESGDSEETFRSSSQPAHLSPTHGRGFNLFL